MSGMVGLFVLVGYAVGFERAWRLAPSLPAVHPGSALAMILLGAAVATGLRMPRIWSVFAGLAVTAVVAIVLVRLTLPTMIPGIMRSIWPLLGGGPEQRSNFGPPVGMGVDTALAILAVALGEALRRWRRPLFSQIFALLALGVTLVAVIGYIEDLVTFYGAMAPATVVGIALLATAVLLAEPRRGFMRALTQRSTPGSVARWLLIFSTSMVLVIGWAFSLSVDRAGGSAAKTVALLAAQTALIIALTWLLVIVSAMWADRGERQRLALERYLIRAARIDALTGLLSRNEMRNLRLKSKVGARGRLRARLFIDLDRFRSFNLAFGHDAGDELLIEVARRLSTIAAGLAVGRSGGDSFVIEGVDMVPAEAVRLGDAIRTTLAKPYEVQGHTHRLTASVGVAHSDTADGADLRQSSDDAMHAAKRQGGNRVVTFTPAMHAENLQAVRLEQELHRALEDGAGLALAYQPVVRIADGAVVTVEALARWTHPELGEVSPTRFIEIAEATGLIVPLGRALIGVAVRQAAVWHDRDPAGCPGININISPLQFAQSDVIAELVAALEQHDLSPTGFCIEVTEAAFTDDTAIRELVHARKLGFKVAMDDFGAGYSSLSQLPRLPLSSVKLDRSFLSNSVAESGDATMLGGVVEIVHGLGLTAVAEGVETNRLLRFVTACACDAAQGYIFSRPLAPEALHDWLARARAAPRSWGPWTAGDGQAR